MYSSVDPGSFFFKVALLPSADITICCVLREEDHVNFVLLPSLRTTRISRTLPGANSFTRDASGVVSSKDLPIFWVINSAVREGEGEGGGGVKSENQKITALTFMD